jgi:signal transduction histidine kinase
MTSSSAPPAAGQATASRTSWPGAVVERVMSALAADFRRPTGPIVIAVILVIATLFMRGSAPGVLSGTPVLVLSILATAPVAVIRRFPATSIGLMLGASAVFVYFGRLSWPVPAIVGWLVALVACPVLLSKRAAIWAFLATELVVLFAAQSFAPRNTPWDATLAEALAVVAAWGAGEMLRSRRQSVATQAAAAQQVKVLSQRDMLARERASIARELHDVVAHHVSMIAVRAGTAPYAIPGLPEPGQEAFAEIAREARTALTELRVVLGVLRDPARASEATPQPRLGDIEALLERVRGAGTDVSWSVTGKARALPASVELCGYRVVQEAVTNAGRHAPGSQVTVTMAYEPDGLAVTVANTARAGSGAAGSDPPGADRSAPDAGPGTGFGLVGLRERVAMVGGQITTGPSAGGGFEVWALLPGAVRDEIRDETGGGVRDEARDEAAA